VDALNEIKKLNIIMGRIFVMIQFLLIVLLTGCTHNSSQISAIPIQILDYADTVKLGDLITTDKSNNFLVENFSDTKENEKYLDTFAFERKDKNFEEYTNYSIVFYKKSSITTIKNIKANPRIIDRYSQENDLIYKYVWIRGKFSNKYKYKNGIIVNSKIKNISIEDVPKR
jgi:hypothetical protein